MGNQIEEIRNLYLMQSSKNKNYSWRIPNSLNLERQLKNYSKFIDLPTISLPDRQRINFGKTYVDYKQILGYVESTIMQNAFPLPYEKEYIGMQEPLDYIHLRSLVVHPFFQRKGIGKDLIQFNLNLGKNLGKKIICDVSANNKNMVSLLKKNNFEEYFPWKNKKGIEIIRLIHD
jgi:ribosomal protein S18 acetylase RimI-like enzyme